MDSTTTIKRPTEAGVLSGDGNVPGHGTSIIKVLAGAK